jgi:peptidoglycan/xylan/chitin deacetylase (PgdA/CDA1 family)
VPPHLTRKVAWLRSTARAYAARYEPIPGLAWPGDARIAVNITVDFDAMLKKRLDNEPAMQKAMGEFEGRVGIWRMIDLFNAHGIPATFFTPGLITELYPQALRSAAGKGHEIADHMWDHSFHTEGDTARDHLRRTAAAFEQLLGRRPVGTRSIYTTRLLAQEGCLYRSDMLGAAYHLPHYLRDASGDYCLLELPFHWGTSDAMLYSFGWSGSPYREQRLSSPDRAFELRWASFRYQYESGGYLNLCLHPGASGRALLADMLDRLITQMKALPGVWFATCEAVARHCRNNYPPSQCSA